ncbi:MAG: SPOR domain-containing protein [Candidatus Omnitrophota bacterium]
MAQKQDYTQPELFTQTEDDQQYKPQVQRSPFFLRIRNYEKVLLLIMGMVLLGIISFSLGVEKGKYAEKIQSSATVQDVYTIQLAAFKNRALALREAQILLKNGFSPVVFTKGSYIILCVGKFSNQESAQPLLTQLQRTYANCRIRRL